MAVDQLAAKTAALMDWLFDSSLPLWWEVGANQTGGGFYEAITWQGEADRAAPRARVQPRQIYCYAAAGRLGWQGPWQRAVSHGLTGFDNNFRLPSGFYGNVTALDGSLTDATFDLYNHAFALFAFATAASQLPERRQQLARKAGDLLHLLQQQYGHPEAGFEEGKPRQLPLRSNPHMHLFEAMLAWEEVPNIDAGPFTAVADEIANLCQSRFIDGRSGALREFFDGDWRPAAGDRGRIVEPGHQFEWAWLLTRWGQRRDRPQAIAHARRMYRIAETHGICAEREVAIMSLYDDFSVHDDLARLWPQTEWLKAAMLLACCSEDEQRDEYLRGALRAIKALERFLDVPIPGLWRDKLRSDGQFIEESAPASSFYHIVCALAELSRLVEMSTLSAATKPAGPAETQMGRCDRSK